MPGFNRTGPQGAGPMSGGARGLCNPAAASRGAPVGRGFGYGRGMAYGRGFRGGYGPGMGMRNYFGPPALYQTDEASELNILKAQADDMKKALEDINSRISDLEKNT